ncbi:unnamed protein product [Calypogeia fissa]
MAANATSPLVLGSPVIPAVIYAHLIPNSFYSTFYYVNLIGITVNNTPLAYPAGTFDINSTSGIGGFIIDTGTTLTQLYSETYGILKNAISGLITYPFTTGYTDFDLCYNIAGVTSPVFPKVVFQFANLDVPMPSDNVFLLVDTAGTDYCMFIVDAGPGLSIFGNVQQQNFNVVYDLVNARVGFTPTKC